MTAAAQRGLPPRAAATLLLSLLVALAPTPASTATPDVVEADEAFRVRVKPIVRGYIFDNYERFRNSELTFRDLKEHVAEVLGMSYEDLKADELSCVHARTIAVGKRCRFFRVRPCVHASMSTCAAIACVRACSDWPSRTRLTRSRTRATRATCRSTCARGASPCSTSSVAAAAERQTRTRRSVP